MSVSVGEKPMQRWCEGGENSRQHEVKVKPRALGRIKLGMTEQKVSI